MKTRRKAGTGGKQQAAPRKRATAQRSARPVPRKPAAVARTRTESAALTADCTIAQAGAIKSRLARVLAKPAPVTLDLSDVRRIDTAGLQVLAAFIRERRAAGRAVECQGASEAFLVTADLLGLGALFRQVRDDRLSAPAAGNA
jgi:phospholipid transport system transporter-binding protein